MSIKNIVLLTCFTLSSIIATAQTVTGQILDGTEDGEPLPFATVIVKNTTTGTQTDFDGNYTLEFEPGTYTLEYGFVGFLPQNETITLVTGQAIEITKTLEANIIDEVVVVATKRDNESEDKLLLKRQKANTIQEAIGYQEMSDKGVSDAGAAVAKITGVSKQEGSGNVYVRGLGDRYLNTTLNGLSLPSNDINKKNIDLNLFPSDVISNVGISKAYAASLYDDFAAGNVDIASKDYTGKGFFDATVNSGFNTRAIGENFVKSEGTGSVGFYTRYEHNPYAVVLSNGVDPVNGGTPINTGISAVGGKSFTFENDSKLSFFATASFDNNYQYRRGSTIDYTNTVNKAFSDAEEFEYGTTTTAMGSVVYKLNPANKFKFNTIFLNSSSDEVGYFGIDGKGLNRDAIQNTDSGFFQMNVQFNQNQVFVNQLIGEHELGEKTNLEWAVGYNNVVAHEPDRKRISIENYQFALDSDPSTNPVFFTNNRFDNQRYFQNVKDQELTSRINLSHELSETIKLNVGLNGRTKERNFDNIRYGYEIIDPNTPITNVNNLDAIFDVSNLGTVFNTFVFNPIDPSMGITQTNFPGLLENEYTGNLDILAGFVSGEFKFGEKWLVVPGVRVESFNQEINYNVINLSPSDPGFRKTSETLFLPSLNVKYSLNEKQNLRFAFSNTASFPEFKEVAPFVYEGVAQRTGGNPDLLGGNGGPAYSKIYNLDVKYEWFMEKGEIISIGAFAKEIHDPVNLVIANDATGTQRYFRTGDKASIFGVELEARKDLLSSADEDGLKETKLSAGFNATYMHTEQDLRNSTGLFTSTLDRTDELQGASPLILNADVSYTPTFGSYKPVANLVFTYFADRVFALGSGQLGNKVEKGIPTLDFIWKNKLKENMELNFSAKNLLDPSIKIIRENTAIGDVTLSEYKRGINIGFQFKYNF
jgi:TonB-dependent receptor